MRDMQMIEIFYKTYKICQPSENVGVRHAAPVEGWGRRHVGVAGQSLYSSGWMVIRRNPSLRRVYLCHRIFSREVKSWGFSITKTSRKSRRFIPASLAACRGEKRFRVGGVLQLVGEQFSRLLLNGPLQGEKNMKVQIFQFLTGFLSTVRSAAPWYGLTRVPHAAWNNAYLVQVLSTGLT